MLAKNKRPRSLPAKFALSLCILIVVHLSCIVTGYFRSEYALASETKDIQAEVINETGCPVAINSAKAKLELDPFGAPLAARIYIDYKNVSEKPISAVKFRIGYVDAEGQLRGTFHAPHAMPLAPGAQSAEKWRGDRLDPRTSSIKVRTLFVKFTDGIIWESEKVKSLEKPADNVQ